jgi:hypothetical protein
MKNTPSSVSSIESLEPRLAPAGIVNVTTTGGVLTITGTNDNNFVAIVSTQANIWEVKDSSEGGTTQFSLNGKPAVSTLSLPTFQSIKVNLLGGDDTLVLTSVQVNGALTVLSGEGNDTVDFLGSVNGAVSMDTGNGNDTVYFSGGILNNTIGVKMGAGDDDVLIFAGFYGKGMNVDLGTGSNDFTVSTTNSVDVFGALNVTAAGTVGGIQRYGFFGPSITLASASLKTTTGSTSIALGSLSDDTAHATHGLRVTGDLKLALGAADDIVFLSRNIFVGGQFNINAGNGINDVTVGRSTTNVNLLSSLQVGSLIYTGGTGADRLNIEVPFMTVAGVATINVAAGNNELFLKGNEVLISGDMKYVGGAGSDVFNIQGGNFRVGGVLSVASSGGANDTRIIPVAGSLGSLNVTGAAGDDLIYLGNTDGTTTSLLMVLGKTVTNVGTGVSDVRLTDVLLHDTIAHTSSVAAGGDYFGVNDSYLQGSAVLNMSGNANAVIQVNDSYLLSDFTISTGGGVDVVAFDTVAAGSDRRSEFYGIVSINLGAGDDGFVAGANPLVADVGNRFFYLLKLDGGTGNDVAEYEYSGNGSNIFESGSLNPILTSIALS